MHVLITGGLGFIGRACVERLLERGVSVTVLDSLEPTVHGPSPDVASYAASWGGRVDLVVGSVTDRERLRPLVQRSTAVIHLASLTSVPGSWLERARFSDENITGTAVLCDLVTETVGVGRLVLASSRAVYGEGPYRCRRGCPGLEGLEVVRDDERLSCGEWDPRCPECGDRVEPLPSREDSRLGPVSFYGTTKLAQEQLVRQVAMAGRTAITVLRLQNVYGPGQGRAEPDVGVANILSHRAHRGWALSLYEDGGQVRDYIYIDDVAELMVDAALHGLTPRSYELFNVGTGRGLTLEELARTIVEVSGRNVRVFVSGKYRVGDVRHAVADVSRLAGVRRFRPVLPEEGLRRLADWFAGRSARTRRTPARSRSLPSSSKGLLSGAS